MMTEEQDIFTKLNNSATLQWKPFNVITLDQKDTDNINKMITIKKYCHLKMHDNKSFLGLGQFDHIK